MQTALTQPALFVIEYALAQVWLSLGVRPQVMVGHSLGEYVAAVLAGIFTLEDALHLLAVRGRLMQSLPAGTMLAVVLPEAELQPLLTGGLGLAAVNSAKACVVSGPGVEVDAFAENLAARGVGCRELKTSHAFHSSMMDPILAEFEAEVARVPRRAPVIPIVSSLYGRLASDEEWMSPAYWSGQLRHAVRFADAVGQLLGHSSLALLEVGPGQTLTALARQHPARQPSQPTIHSCPRTCKDSEVMEFLTAAGQLWCAGVEIDWAALHRDVPRRRISLPTYPFERKRYWIEPMRLKGAEAEPAKGAMHQFLVPNGHDLAAVPLEILPSEVEELIGGQLRLMEQQIEVLSASSRNKGRP
jgi:acyl transferase domain-containing protein